MFASRVTKAVTVDGYGEFIIRKLNRTRQNEAQSVHQYRAAEHFKKIGGAAFVKDLESLNDDKAKVDLDAQKEAVDKDPLLSFDRPTLIRYGVIKWPGDEPKPEQIEDLEAELEERLAREIYDLFRPKTEDERKKD